MHKVILTLLALVFAATGCSFSLSTHGRGWGSDGPAPLVASRGFGKPARQVGDAAGRDLGKPARPKRTEPPPRVGRDDEPVVKWAGEVPKQKPVVQWAGEVPKQKPVVQWAGEVPKQKAKQATLQWDEQAPAKPRAKPATLAWDGKAQSKAKPKPGAKPAMLERGGQAEPAPQ